MAYTLKFYLAFFFVVKVQRCPLQSGRRRLRSGSAHCDRELEVEVRQRAHCERELAVEVRRCPLQSQAGTGKEKLAVEVRRCPLQSRAGKEDEEEKEEEEGEEQLDKIEHPSPGRWGHS